MFRWPFITTIEPDERTALFAAEIAREHNLQPADSVHAALAILWKAEIHVLQARDRDYSAMSHKMDVEAPSFASPQPLLHGVTVTHIGPRPDDFRGETEDGEKTQQDIGQESPAPRMPVPTAQIASKNEPTNVDDLASISNSESTPAENLHQQSNPANT